MANSQYDLDISGGLMPQIQALLAPPSLEDISKEKRKEGLALHPYYRRPGRGHNRDSCDACKEGGGLICCDACPASFHLQCHDPPLEEASLPLGEWLCHSCRMRKAEGNIEPLRANESEEEEFDSDTNKNGKRSRCSGIRGKSKTGGRGTPVSLLKRQKTDNSEETDCEQKLKCEKSGENEELKGNANKNSIMGPLIKVAASMNPEQFELPSELIEPVNFPGTSKVYSKKSSSGPRKKSYELDNGMVPLPLRACFYCNKSCRKAPMVACDYCSLVFHLDCLDPPLVCMPVGKWMCPNHPQNIEYKLLPNACLTERIKFWSFCQRPIDHESVKINFLRKIHRKNPPFRIKVPLPTHNRVKVPQAIKDHYKYPPLLPARLTGPQPFHWASILPETRKTIVIDEESNKDVIEEIAKDLQDEEKEITDDVPLSDGKNEKEPEQSNDKKSETENEKLGTPSYRESDERVGNDAEDGPGENETKCGAPDCEDAEETKQNECEGKCDKNDNKEEWKEEKSELEVDAINIKSEERVNPISQLQSEGENAAPSTMPIDEELSIIEEEVKAYLATLRRNIRERSLKIFMEKLSEDLLTSLDANTLRLLAMQRIQELILNPTSRSLTIFPFPGLLLPETRNDFPSGHWFQTNSNENDISKSNPPPQQPRAFLCPLNAAYPPAPVYHRQLTVGLGANMDLNLSSFGTCQYISGHHATVFYDEMSKHYELLNYSEHGTIVDNVVYCCDITAKLNDDSRDDTEENKDKEKHNIFHGISESSRRNASEKVTCSSSDVSTPVPRCGCRTSSSSFISSSISGGGGWEGTALLTHGSHIKFGCLQFILCISNTNEKPRFIHH